MKPEIIGDVRIGSHNTFCPGVVILGPAVIGDGNYFGTNTVVGGLSRLGHRSRRRDAGEVRIGSGNYFGDHAVVHAPVGTLTEVGDLSSVGAGSIVAHDARIGSRVTLSVRCSVGGHCVLLDGSGLGIGCSVRPRTVMGHWSFAGTASAVVEDVGIGELVAGNPARLLRWNFEGLTRFGLDREEIADVRGFLESGSIPAEGPVPRAAEEFRAAVRSTNRKPALRSWPELEAELSRG